MTDINATLAQRNATHGDYREQAAFAQQFKRMMRAGRNWERLDFHQAQSLEEIANKVPRILCGNYNDGEHWHDIGGYARLVEIELHAQAQAQGPVGVRPRPDDEPLNAPEFLTRMESDLNGNGGAA